MTLVCDAIDLPNAAPVDLDTAEQVLGRVKPKFSKARGLCLNPSCRVPLGERRSLAKFCSDPCRTTYNNQAKVRGSQVIDQALRWRRFRNKGDFTKFVAMLDQMIREDKEAGRTHYKAPPVHTQARVVGRNISGRKRR